MNNHDAQSLPPAPTMTLGQMVGVLWSRRYFLLAITLCSGILVGAISLFIKPVFRATVTMAPPAKGNDTGGLAALAGQFSGLADLAGVSLGGGGDVDQSIALMTSRQFTEQFMREEKVLQTMYPELWDPVAGKWKRGAGRTSWYGSAVRWLTSATGLEPQGVSADGAPNMWLAFKKFDQYRRVAKDKKTALVVLTMDWTDPQVAARWANDLVAKLNRHARDRAIIEADRNLEYLNTELQKTRVMEMQQTVYKLIEREMRAKMSANVREEYAFRVLDPALPPEERESPKRTLMVLAAMVAAGFFASLWVLFAPPSGSLPRRS